MLAYMPVNPNPSAAVPAISPIIPSLHRPDLLNYYLSYYAPQSIALDDLAQVNVLRQIMLRPVGQMGTFINGVLQSDATPAGLDHPNFTGSNPGNSTSGGQFDPINGPWDVDNDGDGIPDSVWVDYGRRCKRPPTAGASSP